MKLKLIDKKQEASDAVSFIFKPETLPAGRQVLSWVAGQFMVYSLPHPNPDIRGKQRFFTISSAPFEKNPTISTRIFDSPSSFKKALNSMKLGEEILAKGPDGDFVIDNPNQQSVFLAGGIGITPYRSIILDLNNKKKPLNIILLYANSTPDFVFKDELEKIAKTHPNFKIHYFVSPNGIDEKAISKQVPNLQKPIFYVSGPEKMVEDFTEMLKGMGIKEDHIKQDFFPGYEAI